MSHSAVHIDHISKQYQIGLSKKRHDTLRDHIMDAAAAVFRRNGKETQARNSFWALKDISLEIPRGQAIGIIGRNGAGKSTLLKILTRITKPTSGLVEIRGRMAALLEVGTGFHGELTGRENVFLNGAILGMKKAEIKRKLDEIIDFSGVEKFIDTPVKRYSSGMYVRLAFAVAAHLEPEILIVDEVLAVGDHEFQKRCLGKMNTVAKAGRTVLFVSHNMESITHLCSRAIHLENGKVVGDGESSAIVQSYLGRTAGETSVAFSRSVPPSPRHEAWISSVDLMDTHGNSRDNFLTGEPIRFRISFQLTHPNAGMEVGLVVTTDDGRNIIAPNSRQQHGKVPGVIGTNWVECQFEGPPLTAKRYLVRVDLGDYQEHFFDSVENAVSFEVNGTDYFGTGRWPNPTLAVVSKCTWEVPGKP
jgi:lipopolysaccharide transport system ATP-binding protein